MREDPQPSRAGLTRGVAKLTYESLPQELFGFCGPVLRLLPLSACSGRPYAAQVHPSFLPIDCIPHHQAVSTHHLTYISAELVTQLGTCKQTSYRDPQDSSRIDMTILESA